MTKFKVIKEGNCSQCGITIFLILNTQSEKEFWMRTKPADITRGDDWKDHFHNPSWCKDEKKEQTKPSLKEEHKEGFEQDQRDYEAWKDMQEQEQRKKSKPTADFQTADQSYQFDRTFKLVEITLSKTRKLSNETIRGMPQYENFSPFIAVKLEVEMGADFQRIVREQFAAIEVALTKQIEQERLRYIPKD